MEGLHLIVVSGLSGSGKTYMLKCFEDMGYFCVDNLPSALLPTFAELCLQQGGEVRKVALGIDIRERGFFGDFIANLDHLKALGHSVELLFLEARDEILVRRFSESRRPHPLLPRVPVLEGVQLERERLLELRGRADRIIDTSDLTVHEFKELVTKQSAGLTEGRPMTVSLLSFGYKFGVPFEADLLFDVRFLRNPNFVAELKALTGEDARVQAHVFDDPDALALLDRLEALLQFLLPCYERERRSYLTIGIGCTGGRHRSVAIALRLCDRLAKAGCTTTLRHRDLAKS